MSLALIVYLVLLATDAVPYLRGPSVPQWRWSYDFDPALHRLWPLGLVLALVLGFCALVARLSPEHLTRRREAELLVALVLLALSVQAAVLFVERENVPALLFDRIVSPTANGFFSVAVTVDDVGEMLRSFPAWMKAFPYQHPSTHPPGILLLYVATLRLMEGLPALAEPLGMWARTLRCADLGLMALGNAQLAGAALLGFLLPLLSTLTLWPLYRIGKRLYGVRGALRSGLLYAFVPAVSLFATQADQLYPLFASLAVYWLLVAFEERRWGYALLAGLVLSWATYMSVVNLLLLALPVIYFPLRIACGQERGQLSRRHLLLCAAAFLLGLASVWIVYQALFGVSPFAVLEAATHDLKVPPLPAEPTLFDRLDQVATRLREVNGGRSYLIWAVYNLYDFIVFLGLPLSALFFVAAARATRRLWERRLTAAQALALALALALLALDLSGIIRGEVGRIWLFLMPFGALAAAGASLSGWPSSLRPAAALQLAQAAVFALSLTVVDPVLWPMPAHERSLVPPPVGRPLACEFGGTIRLLGYDLTASPVTPGDALDLVLYWQSVAQTPVSYKVFVHLLDSNGQIQGQKDSLPLNGGWPTTCWLPGEVIADLYTILVPPDAPPGDYTLAAGFYKEGTEERLPSVTYYSTSDGKLLPLDKSDRVELGPVVVSPAP